VNLDDLIQEAEKVKSGAWDSPLKKIFAAKAVRYIENNFGTEYAQVLSSALRMGVVRSGQQSWNQAQHTEKMQGVIDVLAQLKDEEALEPSRHSKALTEKSVSNTTYHVNGENVQFGNDNTVIKNITITNVVEALEKEIAKLPESKEKTKVLEGFRALTQNETFANLTGSALGVLLGNIVR
jgi:outer membrane protein OmpA-like peptidoglycan-associated protein